MWQLGLWVILFQQILYLQEAITNLTAPLGDNDTVTLDDICFKPLAPDNNYCTINSIVQYFQVRIFPHIIRVPCTNLCVCLVITGTENCLLLLKTGTENCLLLLRLLAYTKMSLYSMKVYLFTLYSMFNF